MRSHPAEPSKQPNPRNTKHGLTLMKRGLKLAGTKAIDRRTSVGKALDHWRDQLIADLGGDQQVSTQQLAVVTLAVRTKLLLDSIDNWLLHQPSLINARKRAVIPAVTQRQQLADSLSRLMKDLGLERRAKTVPTLQQYLETKSKEMA